MSKEVEEPYNEINSAIDRCDKCIEEMQKIICYSCQNATGEDDFIPCNEICVYCKITIEALIKAGYHKTEVKTNGDYIRKMYAKSDEVLAGEEISITYNYCIEEGKCICECFAKFVNKTFDAYYKAYNANLEWLKQEYKEE